MITISYTMNANIAAWYAANTERVRRLMRDIWEHPETGFVEAFAAGAVAQFMRDEGFVVESWDIRDPGNANAKSNTVVATWGSGKPVIAIAGELDALPGLGQDAVPERSAIEGPGHGCGHNLMAGGAAGAACAMKYVMEKEGLTGTIQMIQCPAEELGSGKVYMAKAGIFDNLDLILMWHPYQTDFNFTQFTSRGTYSFTVGFKGQTAHAAANPWDGRSGVDAVQLMNLGCEFLREHVPPRCQFHYRIVEGGRAANIVPDYGSVEYLIRGYGDTVDDLFERIKEVAQGAAIMTRTEMEIAIDSASNIFINNGELHQRTYSAALKVPPIVYTPEEYAFGRALYESVKGTPAPERDEDVLATGIMPFSREDLWDHGTCSDVSEMSWFCPTIHYWGGGGVKTLPWHHWAVTATAGMGIGEKAAIFAFEVLAQTAYDALTDEAFIRDCWVEFRSLNTPPYRAKM